MKLLYKGDLKTECRHDNGAVLETVAPAEIGGKEAKFSPTDLLAVSLASCILTTMAIAAKKMGIDLHGATGDVVKEMTSVPTRRIGKLVVRIRVPFAVSSEAKAKLEEVALKCPIHASLHPDVKLEIDFIWGI